MSKWFCQFCREELPDERTPHCGETYAAAPACTNCGGTGAVDTPFSGSDPCCPECDGDGFITGEQE